MAFEGKGPATCALGGGCSVCGILSADGLAYICAVFYVGIREGAFSFVRFLFGLSFGHEKTTGYKYRWLLVLLAGETGIEPATNGFGDRYCETFANLRRVLILKGALLLAIISFKQQIL